MNKIQECHLERFGSTHALLVSLFFAGYFLLGGCLSTTEPQSRLASPAFENDLSAPAEVADRSQSASSDSVAFLTFYSHEFGEYFPHAFVELKADVANPNGTQELFGFTAKKISPAILIGSVKGEVRTPEPGLVRNSNPHFTVALTSAQLEQVWLVRKRWSDGEGSRYSLNTRNCVHFVDEIAESIGLTVNRDSKNFKRPKRFLEEVAALNPTLNLNETTALAFTGRSEMSYRTLIATD
ncbi:hypothetical protein GCM10009069_05610 [Algimonas arctica]|uniref:Uncharacterized protein n=1 Tax=Algimonas arctica TaxID=1479486 RepID=A0A8J3CQC8_9PROT|nr:hypothetical protein [Algimonas arctica]GHA85349.1 hypothetical protein GCM10009069_05610 [Algimonas arctica]